MDKNSTKINKKLKPPTWKTGNFQFKVKLNNAHTLGEINRKSMSL